MGETIAEKLKRLRTESKLSLEELSIASGFDVKQLESIENGTLSPCMPVVNRLMKIIGLRTGTVLDGSEQGMPVVRLKSDICYPNKNNRQRPHLDFFSLSEEKADRHMEPYVITVGTWNESGGELSTHEGEEFLYVLGGEIELKYADKVYQLQEGDSIYFDSIVPHSLYSKTEQKAKVLSVMYFPL